MLNLGDSIDRARQGAAVFFVCGLSSMLIGRAYAQSASPAEPPSLNAQPTSSLATDAAGAGPADQAQSGAGTESSTIQTRFEEQQRQIEGLQHELAQLRDVERREAEASAPVRMPAAKPGGSAAAGNEVPEMKNPEQALALEFKGFKLVPGGFVAAETIFRRHAEQNDMISTFSGIPYNGDPRTQLTEFRGSARQSRLSLLAEGKVGHVTLTGYWELDFLGAVPNANENQASGFTPRNRQLFAQVALDSGWTISAGQTWSLITMNKKGTATRSEWAPATIEAQYVVGYNFARMYTARVAKSFADEKVTLALSAETPAYLVAGAVPKDVSGVPGGVLSTGIGSLGNGVNYTTGLAPDLIAKVALDPGWGHYEIKGVTRFFRDRVVDGKRYDQVGGGVGGGAILPLIKGKLDILAQGLVGAGTARYNDSGTADLVVRPNGKLTLVPAASALAGVELKPNAKFDFYAYGGTEYQGQAYGSQNGTAYGYGNPNTNLSGCYAPGTSFACSADFRDLDQFATGFWYRPLKGPFGTLQFGMQYSYTEKRAWSGVNGDSGARVRPLAVEHMAFTSLRYYIP